MGPLFVLGEWTHSNCDHSITILNDPRSLLGRQFRTHITPETKETPPVNSLTSLIHKELHILFIFLSSSWVAACMCNEYTRKHIATLVCVYRILSYLKICKAPLIELQLFRGALSAAVPRK